MAPTLMPSLASLPWTRTQPQLRSSRPGRMMSRTVSFGRAGHPGYSVARQRLHRRCDTSLCRHSEVWGLTKNTLQRSRLSTLVKPARSARSAGPNRPAPGTWRWSTFNWWRSTKLSTLSCMTAPAEERTRRFTTPQKTR